MVGYMDQCIQEECREECMVEYTDWHKELYMVGYKDWYKEHDRAECREECMEECMHNLLRMLVHNNKSNLADLECSTLAVQDEEMDSHVSIYYVLNQYLILWFLTDRYQ